MVALHGTSIDLVPLSEATAELKFVLPNCMRRPRSSSAEGMCHHRVCLCLPSCHGHDGQNESAVEGPEERRQSLSLRPVNLQ